MSKEKREKKPKSLASKIVSWVLTGVFGILFLFVMAGTIDGMVHKKENFGETLRFGWASFVVQSDSMANKDDPHCLNVGTAILTYKENMETVYKRYESGDKMIDVSFFDYYSSNAAEPEDTSLNDRTVNRRKVMTHRIRQIVKKPEVKLGEGRYIIYASGTNPGTDQQAGQYQVFTERYYLGTVKLNSPFLGGFFKFIGSVWGLLILLLIPALYLVIASVLDIFKAFKEDEEPKKVTANGADIDGGNRLSGMSEEDKARLKQELLNEMVENKRREKNSKGGITY